MPDPNNEEVIELEPTIVDGQEVFAQAPQVAERPSLDEVERVVLGRQAAAAGLPVSVPSKKVMIGREGTIELVRADDTNRSDQLSVISDEVFSARDRPSLDAIRDQILGAQRSGDVRPGSPRQKLVVDRAGTIGFDSDLDDGRPLSEVTQETFASERLVRDRRYAATHLPEGTREEIIDGIVGWRYEFNNEFNEHFVMWTFFDGSLYQVALISPAAESVAHQHDQHLFLDGYLCLSLTGGARDLESAWSRSALWATGFTVYRETGVFPFSIDNHYPL